MMGIGTAALLSGSYAWGIASVFCYGIGIGLTVPTTNLVVARAVPAKTVPLHSTC